MDSQYLALVVEQRSPKQADLEGPVPFMAAKGRKVMSVVTAAISKAPGAGCEKGSPSGRAGETVGLLATILQPSNSTGL